MNDRCGEWNAWQLKSILGRRGVAIEKSLANRLLNDGFRVEWIPGLLRRAQATVESKRLQKDAAGGVVVNWLKNGRWSLQVVGMFFDQIGLWRHVHGAERFRRTSILWREGMRIWLLEPLWKVVQERAEHPLPYLDTILRDGAWGSVLSNCAIVALDNTDTGTYGATSSNEARASIPLGEVEGSLRNLRRSSQRRLAR